MTARSLRDGIVTLIKYPGADYTQVHGINNKGHIVGYYLKAGQYYGFIGKPIVKVANGNKRVSIAFGELRALPPKAHAFARKCRQKRESSHDWTAAQ